ncbi:hypothetical protein AO391_12330 [Pseudomonas marginalis ICMP 9505]|nr:hypothetical protein AO391_12330 [Pseudomonas marginalis ICMP 9505]
MTVLLYWPSYWAYFAFSGKRFSPLKFWGVIVYNILFGSIHVFFVQDGTLPFMGQVDNSVMGWVSLVMIFVYSFSLPADWERKRWFSLK